jgi:hypothetical protein
MDSPTVPKAETVSKRYSTKKRRLSKGSRSPAEANSRREVTRETENPEAKMMAMVREMRSLGMVRQRR